MGTLGRVVATGAVTGALIFGTAGTAGASENSADQAGSVPTTSTVLPADHCPWIWWLENISPYCRGPHHSHP
jgi:hypothetical protein